MLERLTNLEFARYRAVGPGADGHPTASAKLRPVAVPPTIAPSVNRILDRPRLNLDRCTGGVFLDSATGVVQQCMRMEGTIGVGSFHML